MNPNQILVSPLTSIDLICVPDAYRQTGYSVVFTRGPQRSAKTQCIVNNLDGKESTPLLWHRHDFGHCTSLQKYPISQLGDIREQFVDMGA